MKPRPRKMVTLSVDEETARMLRAEAKRRYGGDVSALVAAMAKEARRQASVSTEQRARILACTESAQLDTWLLKAATAASADELF